MPQLDRRRGRVMAIAVALLAIGVFLAWGPVGLGNGPLLAQTDRGSGGIDAGGRPIGLVSKLSVADGAAAMVDSVQFTSPAAYSQPRVFAVLALGFGVMQCSALGPLRRVDSRHFLTFGCARVASLGQLVGHQVRPGPKGAIGMGVETSAPPLAGCWAISALVVHYHVGIRHYAATYPDYVTVCGTRTNEATRTAAMDAASAAAPSS